MVRVVRVIRIVVVLALALAAVVDVYVGILSVRLIIDSEVAEGVVCLALACLAFPAIAWRLRRSIVALAQPDGSPH